MSSEELTVAQIKTALKRLQDGWPRSSGLMIFADGNALRLCAKHPQGGGKVVESYEIPNDGGDPDWEDPSHVK